MQEKIAAEGYVNPDDPDGPKAKFKAVAVLNLVQVCCTLMSTAAVVDTACRFLRLFLCHFVFLSLSPSLLLSIYKYLTHTLSLSSFPSFSPFPSPSPLPQATCACTVGLLASLATGASLTATPPTAFFLVSVTTTIASPFGYYALNFVPYPLFALGKACKLVPVMLMSIFVNKQKFTITEYSAVGLISLGGSPLGAVLPLATLYGCRVSSFTRQALPCIP